MLLSGARVINITSAQKAAVLRDVKPGRFARYFFVGERLFLGPFVLCRPRRAHSILHFATTLSVWFARFNPVTRRRCTVLYMSVRSPGDPNPIDRGDNLLAAKRGRASRSALPPPAPLPSIWSDGSAALIDVDRSPRNVYRKRGRHLRFVQNNDLGCTRSARKVSDLLSRAFLAVSRILYRILRFPPQLICTLHKTR